MGGSRPVSMDGRSHQRSARGFLRPSARPASSSAPRASTTRASTRSWRPFGAGGTGSWLWTPSSIGLAGGPSFCRPAPHRGRGDRAPRRAAPARRARAGGPAATAPFRHRPVTRRPPPADCRPSLPADPWEPVLTYVSPSPSRPALALAGPACRALQSDHPGNAPAGLTAGSGTGAGNRLCTA